MTDPHALLQLSARLLAMGLLIRSLETLLVWREFRRGGLLAAHLSEPGRTVSRAIDNSLAPPAVTVGLLLLQALAATTTLVWPMSQPLPRAAATLLFATTVLGYRRFPTLRNAADVMSVIAQGGVTAAALDEGDGTLRSVGLTFIALQASIAYLATGMTKLRSPIWRSGRAIGIIFENARYGRGWTIAFVTRHVALQPVIAWSTILVELLLGVAALLPTPSLLALLAGGLVFHLSVAFQMRLYSFFWAFIATYPALYFLHTLIYGKWSRISD